MNGRVRENFPSGKQTSSLFYFCKEKNKWCPGFVFQEIDGLHTFVEVLCQICWEIGWESSEKVSLISFTVEYND